MATGFLYDPRYLNHQTGWQHPESPERLVATLAHLKKVPWFEDLVPVQAREATPAEIIPTHTPDYIAHVKQTCEEGCSVLDSPDVGISEDSYEIATLAAGGALALADKMVAGDIDNGFGLLRPPGHHAEHEGAMGFCLFNNVAILARYLQRKHGLNKILILDWDVHHGNGTQHTFEEDPSVLYVSLHQFPFYPGTGAYHEKGIGAGKGYTLNCPMSLGSTDKDYEEAFVQKILPRAQEFKPEAVLISAGFDAHAADPLGGIRLSTQFFGWMTERVIEIADKYAGGRLLSLLEGGYNLEYLPLCIEQHLAGLSYQSRRSSL